MMLADIVAVSALAVALISLVVGAWVALGIPPWIDFFQRDED